MKKPLLVLVLAFICISNLKAQRYLVRLKDKGASPYSFNNPTQYLSQRAIDRRSRFSIAIDSADLPVSPQYLNALKEVPGVSVLNASRWLNQVSIFVTDPNALTTINSFPFVISSSQIASRLRTDNATTPIKNWESLRTQQPSSGAAERITTDYYDYGTSYDQVHLHNGEFLHNIGLRGQTMVIGMLDAGFQNYTTVTGFDSARNNGQILGTWDFVDGNSSVSEDHPHGEQCFSILAANIPGVFVGTAPKANYFLFKTEDINSEYPIEEHNWVCGAERVDSAGGDLISSSLGYFYFDSPATSYTYADMDGNTTIAARGADMAAKKGLVVVNAVGNAGNLSWHYLLTPADGDSVLAVGAVNTSGVVGSASSYGPSADGQVKPDIASVGVNTYVQYSNNAIGTGSGTSYSCPNIAGLATCLMQGFPEFNNMQIINAIRQAGNNVATPNDRIGYGIPDMKKALVTLLKNYATGSSSASNCKSTINWKSKDMSAMKYEIERKAPNETEFKKIGERPGTGAIFSNHSYEYIDTLNNVPAGMVAYRIRQIIDTSVAGFTAAIIADNTVEISPSCNFEDYVSISPNPATTRFVLQTNFPQKIETLTISIADMQGNIVDVIKKNKIEGPTNINISVSRLNAGKYYVSLYDNIQLLATESLIKL